MKERPILFKGEMVRAVLDGTKTQTRRVVKPQPLHKDVILRYPNSYGNAEAGLPMDVDYPDSDPGEMAGQDEWKCPYGVPGDELWVRETFALCRCKSTCEGIYFRADESQNQGANIDKWRPSIFMPRWASRIQLVVQSVRVERVQEIDEADAKAEGTVSAIEPHEDGGGTLSYRYGFRLLWDSINGKPRKDGTDISWAANPWVWVVEFERKTQ